MAFGLTQVKGVDTSNITKVLNMKTKNILYATIILNAEMLVQGYDEYKRLSKSECWIDFANNLRGLLKILLLISGKLIHINSPEIITRTNGFLMISGGIVVN